MNLVKSAVWNVYLFIHFYVSRQIKSTFGFHKIFLATFYLVWVGIYLIQHGKPSQTQLVSLKLMKFIFPHFYSHFSNPEKEFQRPKFETELISHLQKEWDGRE